MSNDILNELLIGKDMKGSGSGLLNIPASASRH
jgi:hypothetical protein